MFGKKEKKDKSGGKKGSKNPKPSKKNEFNAATSIPAVFQDATSPVQLSHNDSDLTSSQGMILQQIGHATHLVESIASQWRKISREGDVTEFLYTTELIMHSLERLHGVLQPSLGLSHKLRQFILLLEDYDNELKAQGEKKLSATVNSLIRRRPLVQFNSRVQNELKFVLGASGASTRGVTTVDPRWIRKRSLGRFTVSEGKDFWKSSFTSVEMENVSWDRFFQSLQLSLQTKIELSDERLLKHILDNDNVGAVTPSSFNNFLKTFGPFHLSLQNMKRLFEQKWFHGFLSVEEVVRLLGDQNVGTFLVRFSRSKPDALVLEYVESKGRIRTVEVKCEMPLGVFISEANNSSKTFSSMDLLIQHYVDSGLLKSPFYFDLAHKSWFYGDFSQQEAEEVLATRPPGTFLLRFADSGRFFQYIASYVVEGGPGVSSTVQHAEITKSAGGYCIDFLPASHAIKPASEHDVAELPANLPPLTLDAIPPPLTDAIPLSLTDAPTSLRSAFGVGGETTAIQSAVAELPSPTTLYPSLADLIAACKNVLRFNYDPERVPRLQLADFYEAEKYTDIRGPLISDGTGIRCEPSPSMVAQTVATYPNGSYGWQIVCDQFYVRAMGNRTVFALADGCGWGARPREAAIRAAEAVVEQIADRTVQLKINDTIDCKTVLLRSFNVAHRAIIEGKEDVFMAGTTTLLAGVLAEVDAEKNEWAAVVVSVGDCKCFVYNKNTDTVSDITMGNRSNLHDARDPGGRLGPYFDSGDPDLRNLAAYFWPLHEGDILFAVSDGVHDNIEPEALGKSVTETADTLRSTRHASLSQQVAVDADWAKIDQNLAEKLKTAHMTARLEQLFASVPVADRDHVGNFVSAIITNSTNVTLASRSFMESNPDKPEPEDHKLFPGKMDHTTVVALLAQCSQSRDKMRLAKLPRQPKVGLNSATSLGQAGLGGGIAPALTSPAGFVGKNFMDTSSGHKKKESMSDRDKHRGMMIGSAPLFTSDDIGGKKAQTSPSLNFMGGTPEGSGFAGGIASASTFAGKSPRASLSMSKTPASPRSTPQLKLGALTMGSHNLSSGSLGSPRGGSSPRSKIVRPFEAALESLTTQISSSPVAKYNVDFMKLIKGPVNESEQKFGSGVSAISISTFPAVEDPISKKRTRLADPNTNHFAVELTKNRIVVVLAAGSSIGSQSYAASKNASRICFDNLSGCHMAMDSVSSVATCLARSFDTVHQALESANGATAAIAAVVACRGTSGSRFWNLVIASVGNCKAMAFNPATGAVRDLSLLNIPLDRNDSGGCIGPHDRYNNPDMRNFLLQHALVEEGEVAFFLSPDAAANFDPELLGCGVAEIAPKLGTASWSDISSLSHSGLQQLVILKDEYRCRAISTLLTAAQCSTATQLTQAIVDYCIAKTGPTRELMEADPSANEPTDFSKFPGKMGHITCVSVRIGTFSEADSDLFGAASSEMMSTVFAPIGNPGK